MTKTFNSSINGEAKTVVLSCIYGRDGVNESDLWEYMRVDIDNSDCDVLGDEIAAKQVFVLFFQSVSVSDFFGFYRTLNILRDYAFDQIYDGFRVDIALKNECF